MQPRALAAEWMDDPGLEPGLHEAALVGLARLNRVSRVAEALWRELRPAVRRRGGGRLLDVASGGGDVALALWRAARRERLPLSVAGCDVSPRAVAHARTRAAAAGADVAFLEADALQALPADFDFYTCSLFLHHLADEEIIALLRAMGRGRALVVSDLVRGPLGHAAAWLGARILTRSPVVRADAPLSVRNALTPGELRALAERAGLPGAHVHGCWPFRMVLTWSRT